MPLNSSMHNKALVGTSFFGGGFGALLLLMQFDPHTFVRLDGLASRWAGLFEGPLLLYFFE